MSIENLLLPRKKELLESWFDLFTRAYAPEAAAMLKRESNRFANPVGQTTLSSMADILDEFFGENRMDEILLPLDRIIRIRAVQDLAPSRALAFVFLLKDLARRFMDTDTTQGKVELSDLAEFDARVDGLALAAMDVYSKCRETLHEIRINEIKNRTNRLLLRARVIVEVPGCRSESLDH